VVAQVIGREVVERLSWPVKPRAIGLYATKADAELAACGELDVLRIAGSTASFWCDDPSPIATIARPLHPARVPSRRRNYALVAHLPAQEV
jgi:hypothetical protein